MVDTNFGHAKDREDAKLMEVQRLGHDQAAVGQAAVGQADQVIYQEGEGNDRTIRTPLLLGT